MQAQWKRFLSMVMAIVMVVSMIPANVVFAEENPDGNDGEVVVEPTTEPVTEEPSEPEVTEAETEEPSEPEVTEAATEEPSEPEATEAATEEPSEPEETEAATEEPSEPEATEAETEEPSEPAAIGPVTETVTETVVPDVDLPDNQELFAYFVERELYDYDAAVYGTTARSGLTTLEQVLYDALKTKIENVAINGGGTQFILSDISGVKMTWSNTELGVSSIDSGEIVEAAFCSQFDIDKIISALLADCPFDLYWFDKVEGVEMTYQISRSGIDYGAHSVWDTAVVKDLTFVFIVSADYESGENWVTTDVTRVSAAKDLAAQVVAANAGKSDYEKLVAYKNYICNAVTYDHAAAENTATPYGDPWQLISVFDGDDSTNVVCEGYSKAFQYLCDLGGLDCISVSGSMSTVTVKAKIDGACVITATSTDLTKVEGLLEIFVRDYAPRIESKSLTVNSNLVAGVSTGLISSYGNEIWFVEMTDPAVPFTCEYADGLLTVIPTDVLKNGTYKPTVRVHCADYGPFEIPLTVKVANKLPTVTVKQSGKFNLFYSDSTAELQITVKGEKIKDAELEINANSSFQTRPFDSASGAMTVEYRPEYVEGTTGKLVSKVKVLVTLEGYRNPVSKSVTIATTTTKPSLSLSPASSVINIATQSNHSTFIRVYNKTEGTYLQILPVNVTASFATVSSVGDGVLLELTKVAGKTNTGGSATIQVKEDNWMQPIKLTHKVTVQSKPPAVNLSASTLKLNRVFEKQTASAEISLNQHNLPIGTIDVQPADSKARALVENGQISIGLKGTTVTARLDKANPPANGTYNFKVYVTLADGTALAAKALKVSVSSTTPTVKLKTTTLKLNKVLGTEAAAWTNLTMSKGDGYEIVGFNLPDGWTSSDIAVKYRDGMVYAELLRATAATAKHTVSLKPVLRHIDTKEISELPTAVKLTVQVESKTLGVNVTSSGKLDSTLPDSAIIYTVKSFTNVNGTPTKVELGGTHGGLFEATLNTDGANPKVTLKMRSDIKYNVKTTYKVDLIFTICGAQAKKSVSFKISQSSLKFATIKTLSLYQFQTQPVTATITVTAPAGATIDQITLSSKSALQFRRALGSGGMEVVPIGDGSSALVRFTLGHPGYLNYGKSYTVYLDVLPESTAETVKATQVKLTVKSYK